MMLEPDVHTFQSSGIENLETVKGRGARDHSPLTHLTIQWQLLETNGKNWKTLETNGNQW